MLHPALLPLLLLSSLLAAAVPGVATGQGHPSPPSARPLHARLAEADVVVVATVEAVETGRIAVAVQRRLLGQAPERFQVKRSPTQPPPLAPGDRAVLLLRGARPPYVLVDEPRETIRLVDEENTRRWSAAIEAVLAHRDDPADLVALYLRWIDAGPATLRELGAKALADRSAPFQPLSEAVLLGRATAALDPELPIEARRAAALLAMGSPAATERLLANTPPGSSTEADLSVAMVALQGGAMHRGPRYLPALVRCLDHEAKSLRIAAIRLSASLRESPPAPVVAALREAATSTADPEVRAEARRALSALGQPTDRAD